jgi:hypothetical protein
MSSKRGYDCEIISFVVLFVLSALSHFWYIMIAICAGIAIWIVAAVLTRILLKRMPVPVVTLVPQPDRSSSDLRPSSQFLTPTPHS